jgi:hypothetical protein
MANVRKLEPCFWRVSRFLADASTRRMRFSHREPLFPRTTTGVHQTRPLEARRPTRLPPDATPAAPSAPAALAPPRPTADACGDHARERLLCLDRRGLVLIVVRELPRF